MKDKGWTKGTVGLVTISLARNNGKLRTEGFREAMNEGGIKEAGLQQMQAYTADETFKFTQDMLTANPNMRGMFVQTDHADPRRACAPSRPPSATATSRSPPSTAFPNSSTC